MAKVTSNVEPIYWDFEHGMTRKEIAEKYGLSYHYICTIIRHYETAKRVVEKRVSTLEKPVWAGYNPQGKAHSADEVEYFEPEDPNVCIPDVQNEVSEQTPARLYKSMEAVPYRDGTLLLPKRRYKKHVDNRPPVKKYIKKQSDDGCEIYTKTYTVNRLFILFDTKEQAEAVVADIAAMIDTKGQASLADFYDRIGNPIYSKAKNKGWTNSHVFKKFTHVTDDANGRWKIILARTRPLETKQDSLSTFLTYAY